jgi:4-cresol dehydrogenase (hydroxylating) flavoprotein subunit
VTAGHGTAGQVPVGTRTAGQRPDGTRSAGQGPDGTGTAGQGPDGTGTAGQGPVGTRTAGQEPDGTGTDRTRTDRTGTDGGAGPDRVGAVAAWRGALGDAHVEADAAALAALGRNTSAFRPRELVAALHPGTPEEVVEVVRIARRHRVPVHPFSTGRNWGLGSKVPPVDGCALLDLGRLDRIREVDEDRHYAVIEPGVSQRQLVEHLDRLGARLDLNLTGSTPGSSVIGNAMERGTGFRRHRTEDVRGLEVVLGTGELLRTGFWGSWAPIRSAHHYRHGIGPYLDGLFTESNLGVVTAMVVDLLPRPDELRMAMLSFDESALADVVDALSALYRAGTLREIAHVFNDKRILTMTGAATVPRWTGITALCGTVEQVELTTKELQRAMDAVGAGVGVVTAADAAAPGTDPMVTGMYDLHAGRPGEVFMRGLYQTLGDTGHVEDIDALDSSRHGMLACLPMYPMDGAAVAQGVALTEQVCARHGVVPAVTVNPIDADAAESVINLYFDTTDPAARDVAHACNRDLHRTLHAAGFRFYRADIETMPLLAELDPGLWRTGAALKAAFDPDRIISPGRYDRP